MNEIGDSAKSQPEQKLSVVYFLVEQTILSKAENERIFHIYIYPSPIKELVPIQNTQLVENQVVNIRRDPCC